MSCTAVAIGALRVNPINRGAVVKWLEWLGYGAESHHKVVSLRLGFAMQQLDNSLCQHSSKWCELGSERRGMGSAFHLLCPRYRGNLPPTAPMAIRL